MLIGLSGTWGSKGPVTFRVRTQILKSKPVAGIVAQFIAGHKLDDFGFHWQFHIVIFKIIEPLILNANTANKKQLFGPEKLSGLSRHRPLALRDNGSLKYGCQNGRYTILGHSVWWRFAVKLIVNKHCAIFTTSTKRTPSIKRTLGKVPKVSA